MLDVRRVSKRFGSIHAVTDVSLAAAEGEVVALVRENGAGKSTLVRCIVPGRTSGFRRTMPSMK